MKINVSDSFTVTDLVSTDNLGHLKKLKKAKYGRKTINF